MAKRRGTTRNQNHDDYAKKVKICENGGVVDWLLDLHHHLLYLVMMQLGVVDYLSFGGVCKSWRSLALANRNTFMASKPPMNMRICWHGGKKVCYLKDFEGRKFKTILPNHVGGACLGLTCGYLIFFRRTTPDFWLVNPITRHELYFTNFPITCNFPINDRSGMHNVRAIIVFSRSIRGWMFLLIRKSSNQIWFSTAGTGVWGHVLCTSSLFTDLRAFKGIIYALNFNLPSCLCQHLYELRFNPAPNLTLLETNNSLKHPYIADLASSDESIYVMDRVPPNGNIKTTDRTPEDRYRFQELDFGEMKWVLREKTLGENASFLSNLKHGAVDKPGWGELRGQGLLLGHNAGDILKLIEVEKASAFSANLWYFPHECLNGDHIY